MNLEEYRVGLSAFRCGRPESDCPNPIGSGDKRTSWLVGWWDGRFESKLKMKPEYADMAGAKP